MSGAWVTPRMSPGSRFDTPTRGMTRRPEATKCSSPEGIIKVIRGNIPLHLAIGRVFIAMIEIVLGWKAYEYYCIKPTNFPTQGQPNARCCKKKYLKMAKIVML